jgi:hypothetical protein
MTIRRGPALLLFLAASSGGCSGRALDLGFQGEDEPSEEGPSSAGATEGCSERSETKAPIMSAAETRNAFVGRWLRCYPPSLTKSTDPEEVGLEVLPDGRFFRLAKIEGRVAIDPFASAGATYTIEMLDDPPGSRWQFAVTVEPGPGSTWQKERSVAYFLDGPRRLYWNAPGRGLFVRAR